MQRATTPVARPRPHTHSPARPAPRVQCQVATGWKEGRRGRVSGRPRVTGNDIRRRAGDASETQKVRKSQIPSLAPRLPAARVAFPAARLRRQGGESEPSFPQAALPDLAQGPEPGPSSAPTWGGCQIGSGLAKGLWGSKRAGEEHLARSGRAAHDFLCRHTPS